MQGHRHRKNCEMEVLSLAHNCCSSREEEFLLCYDVVIHQFLAADIAPIDRMTLISLFEEPSHSIPVNGQYSNIQCYIQGSIQYDSVRSQDLRRN